MMAAKMNDIYYEIDEIEFTDGTELKLKSMALLTSFKDDELTLDEVIKRRKEYGYLVDELAAKYK